MKIARLVYWRRAEVVQPDAAERPWMCLKRPVDAAVPPEVRKGSAFPRAPEYFRLPRLGRSPRNNQRAHGGPEAFRTSGGRAARVTLRQQSGQRVWMNMPADQPSQTHDHTKYCREQREHEEPALLSQSCHRH